MKLTNTAVKQAKPEDKPKYLSDGKGLSLLIQPNGSKWWRLRYQYLGKTNMLSLGTYPDVSLKRARDRRDDARRLLADGIDPSEHRKEMKAKQLLASNHTFEAIAREWFTKQASVWAETHSSKIIGRLEKDVFPYIGSKPIADINAPQLLTILRRIENRGAIETAHRVKGVCGQIFRYAVATGRAERDPATDLRGALTPKNPQHLAAVTEPTQLGELLRGIDGYQGTIIVSSALKLAPLVFVRPGELRTARWDDIDFDAKEWRFEVTKTKTQHIVPLARQSVAILKEIQPLTGSGIYVFPSARSQHRAMSENAILTALRTMGIPKHVASGHGFRATARTLLDEQLHCPIHIIEQQLAHTVRDPLGRAYNRTAHLRERKQMMQQWADYLDELKRPAKVLTFKTPS
jgi:integrase